MSETSDTDEGYGRRYGMLRTERQQRLLGVLGRIGPATAADVADQTRLSESMVEEALDRAVRQGYATADVDRTPRYDAKLTAEYELLRYGQRWLDELDRET